MHFRMTNIKYYTNIVPTYVYSKLLDKGMPISCVTYAEVFDWLLEKDMCINIHPDRYYYEGDDMWRYTCHSQHTYSPNRATKGWIKTANDAILHSIELI